MPNYLDELSNLAGLDETTLRRLIMGTEVAKRRTLFALKYHRNTKNQPMDLTRFPYLRQVYADPAERIVLQTGTQSGKTEWCVCDGLAIISCGLSYQNVQPKDEARAMFMRTRIRGPIDQCDFYKEHTKIEGSFVHWRKGGILRITFSTVANEMIAFPADAVSVDERDFCDLDNLTLLPDRMRASHYRFTRDTSTPTTVGTPSSNNINYQYELSDRKVWVVRCEDCGKEQDVDWFRNVIQETRDDDTGTLTGFKLLDEDWSPNCGRDIYPFCTACGHPLDRLMLGRWVKRNPNSSSSGYHLTQLYSPVVHVKELYDDYAKAQGNPRQMQRFANSCLGLPYQGVGDKVTEDMIAQNVQAYEMWGLNLKTLNENPTSMGVDVGGKYLDVRISDHPVEGVRRMRFAGKITWADLDAYVRAFNVSIMVIDMEPERTKALEVQEKLPCRVIVSLTRELQNADMTPALDKLKTKMEEDKVTLDRTVWMDRVCATYSRRQNWVPANWRDIDAGAWLLEMLTPTRVIQVDNKGREKFVWTGGQDHSFLADAYDLIATYIGFFFGNLGVGMETSDRMTFSVAAIGEYITSGQAFEMD